jgi:hypothetical protein
VFVNGARIDAPAVHREVAALHRRCIDASIDTVREIIAANREVRGAGREGAERLLAVMRGM